jgi:hypothetical protein
MVKVQRVRIKEYLHQKELVEAEVIDPAKVGVEAAPLKVEAVVFKEVNNKLGGSKSWVVVAKRH